MDPLTAVSLAGAIIQFVDFSSKLVSRGKELYRSSSGALEENVRIEEVTADLHALCLPLHTPSSSSTNAGLRCIPDAHRISLQKLAASCIEVSNKLMAALQELRIPANMTHKTWYAIKQSVANIFSKEEIAALRSTLEMLQQQLNTRLLAILGLVL
jgi:hypothetical protein